MRTDRESSASVLRNEIGLTIWKIPESHVRCFRHSLLLACSSSAWQCPPRGWNRRSSPPPDQLQTLTVPAGDTKRLSPEGHPYLDPEVLSEHGLVTFIDREKPDAPRRVWVGALDPMTGLFKSGHGRDILIDTGHTSLRFTQQRLRMGSGPQWLVRGLHQGSGRCPADVARLPGRKEGGCRTHYLRRDSSVWWRGLHQPQCRLDTDHCDFGRLGRRRKGLGGRERRHSATPDRADD